MAANTTEFLRDEPDYACGGVEVAPDDHLMVNDPMPTEYTGYWVDPNAMWGTCSAADLTVEGIEWALTEIRRLYISEPKTDLGAAFDAAAVRVLGYVPGRVDLMASIRDIARGS